MNGFYTPKKNFIEKIKMKVTEFQIKYYYNFKNFGDSSK